VQVALHRSQEHLADLLVAALGQLRPEHDHGRLHGLRGHQHLGHEHVAGLEAHTHLLHADQQAVLEDFFGRYAFAQRLLYQLRQLIRIPFQDRG